ncbi:M56 family metallopeptidase [Niabella aurantiaca]|uniref:M56 family metallopeptidase n=1 Tax=Niabella aurantiaca TaxID=379900 RepID=UPI00036075B5|nr:energy transducer TonB [Niabella aurantiaca]
MKTITLYLLQMLLCSGLLYGYYLLFLKDRKLHAFNRCYLLGSFVVSLAVPFIKIPYYITLTKDSGAGLQALVKYNELLLPEVVVSSSQNTPVAAITVLYGLYACVAAFLLARIISSILALIKKRTGSKIQKWRSLTIIETSDPAAPYSFFNWLFWTRSVDEYSDRGRQILQHEYFHMRQCHSADVLFSESITALVWVNPFFWLMKNELKAVHEFSADAFAAGDTDELEYATLLITEAISCKQQLLVHPFFNNQLKRRITMLTTAKNNRHHSLRQWMTLPLFVVAAVLFMISCQSADQQNKQNPDTAASDPATVVPDQNVVIPDSNSVNNTEPHTQTDSPQVTEVLKIAPPRVVKDPEVKRLAPPKIAKNEPGIYTKTEKDASFPGDWARYLMQNLRGEVPVEHGAKPGNYQVIAQFVVDVQGNVSDVKLIKDPGFGMGEEALRVIKKSGKWKPAIVNGKNVKAYRKQPITFQVTEG